MEARTGLASPPADALLVAPLTLDLPASLQTAHQNVDISLTCPRALRENSIPPTQKNAALQHRSHLYTIWAQPRSTPRGALNKVCCLIGRSV